MLTFKSNVFNLQPGELKADVTGLKVFFRVYGEQDGFLQIAVPWSEILDKLTADPITIIAFRQAMTIAHTEALVMALSYSDIPEVLSCAPDIAHLDE
jgi:hypothetical protein